MKSKYYLFVFILIIPILGFGQNHDNNSLWGKDSFGLNGFRKAEYSKNFSGVDIFNDSILVKMDINQFKSEFGNSDSECKMGSHTVLNFYMSGFSHLTEKEIKELDSVLCKGVDFSFVKVSFNFDENGKYESNVIISGGG